MSLHNFGRGNAPLSFFRRREAMARVLQDRNVYSRMVEDEEAGGGKMKVEIKLSKIELQDIQDFIERREALGYITNAYSIHERLYLKIVEAVQETKQ